jgi:ERCC4-type nuclease
VAEGFDVSRETLATGDFLWLTKKFKAVCIERKTVSDLLSSLAGRQENGKARAVNQLTRLREFDHPVLLIEGTMSMTSTGKVRADGRLTSWAWDAVDNFLLTVQQSGITVARCHKGSVPDRLRSLVGYFDKDVHLLPVEESNDKRGVNEVI